jgi:nucleoid-associated protein EbfC
LAPSIVSSPMDCRDVVRQAAPYYYFVILRVFDPSRQEATTSRQCHRVAVRFGFAPGGSGSYNGGMFDQLKNLAQLPQLLGKAREMQEKMKQVQEELGRKTVTADAGAGMVTATVSGKLELMKLRIDAARLGSVNAETGKIQLSPGDVEMIEDLIVAAVRAAQAKAADMLPGM